MHIDGKTKLYGILGNPVTHSLSPAMHNAAFASLGENSVYLPFPTENVSGALTGLKSLGVHGVSVTIPHKERVIDFLDEVDPVARRIGAVNTIVVKRNGGGSTLFGTNTDWLGANRALGLKTSLRGSRAVILGSGGAARAIGFGLLEAQVDIVIQSRSQAKGQQIADILGCEWQPLGQMVTDGADILVNATSVGMQPNDDVSPMVKEALSHFKVVMDIVYAPLETRLLREAAAAGCHCVNGLEMLLFQGAAQFELWTGRAAPLEVMRQALLQASGNGPEDKKGSN